LVDLVTDAKTGERRAVKSEKFGVHRGARGDHIGELLDLLVGHADVAAQVPTGEFQHRRSRYERHAEIGSLRRRNGEGDGARRRERCEATHDIVLSVRFRKTRGRLIRRIRQCQPKLKRTLTLILRHES
jgi:hypothetical protein